MSIAPTPIPPGAAQAAAERRAIIRDETGRVAVALIGVGLDLRDRPGGLREPAIDIARDIAAVLGLIPTVPATPNRSTSAERAMRATSRKAKR